MDTILQGRLDLAGVDAAVLHDRAGRLPTRADELAAEVAEDDDRQAFLGAPMEAGSK